MDNDNFMIEQEDLEFAQHICNGIKDSLIRNRAMANVISAQAAKKYFQDLNADTESGIHNIATVLEDVDISDVYIDGNYIDARIYFDENELYVPKSHFDTNNLPVAYMFIKYNEDAMTAEVTGFIVPEDIDKNKETDGYYVINEDSLKSFYDIEPLLALVDDEGYDSDFEKYVYEYFDNRLSKQERTKIYEILLKSFTARELFKNTFNAYVLFENAELASANEDNNISNDDTNNADLGLNIADDNLEQDNNIEELEPVDLDNGINIDIDDENLLAEPLQDNGIEELSENDSSSVLTLDEQENTDTLSEIPDSEDNLILNQDENSIKELTEYTAPDETANVVEEISEVEHNPTQQDESADTKNEIIQEQEQVLDEIDELSKHDYSTEIMPSMSSIEERVTEQQVTEEMLDAADLMASAENHQQEFSENNEQIDTLFENKSQITVKTSKKKGSPITVLGILALLVALGYYGYIKYIAAPDMGQLPETTANVQDTVNKNNEKKTQDAMPVETVENPDVEQQQKEDLSVSIPAIEQNLNASIDVSNLAVTWEVPAGYANNTTAKRYFMKLGKVLQLNVKTELLMLSSPPITNKISIELEFDKSNNKFRLAKIIDSSGVAVVDNTIKDTVNKVLDMNMNMNMNVFGNLQGNPILIIRL